IRAPGSGSAGTASAVGGRSVPLSSAVKFVSTTAPQQINHIEEMPAVTLTVNPPEGMALETAMGILKDDIIAPMRQAGAIPDTVITTLAGTADKLTQTRRALFGDFRDVVVPRSYLLSRLSAASTPTWLGIVAVAFLSVVVKAFRFSGSRPARIAAAAVFIVLLAPLLVDLAWLVIRLFWENPQLLPMLVQSRAILALVVTYLLMAALFESFVWPFVIIFTVPLATVGGFVGLRIVHELSWRDPVSPIQQLDTLTMLGFVVLIGVVVNNGILVVHQALNNRRDHNLAWPEAIRESVRTRVRPIFMTAFTSIGGMLPLVLWPGSGSELYRGLGSVVVGGLLVATLFTLFLVPAVLSVAVDLGELLRRLLKRQPAPSTMPVQPEPVGRTAPGA
ncbi:MAG: efflux RND transporter permease subunit, partial [bacterium]|nr:efflux RND transporter permease subunit [bacterium]